MDPVKEHARIQDEFWAGENARMLAGGTPWCAAHVVMIDAEQSRPLPWWSRIAGKMKEWKR